MIENIDNMKNTNDLEYFENQKKGLKKVRKLIKQYGYDGYTLAEIDNDIAQWTTIIKQTIKSKKKTTDEL